MYYKTIKSPNPSINVLFYFFHVFNVFNVFLFFLERFFYIHERDSEVFRSTGRQFGTVCHQLCKIAVFLWEHPRGG